MNPTAPLSAGATFAEGSTVAVKESATGCPALGNPGGNPGLKFIGLMSPAVAVERWSAQITDAWCAQQGLVETDFLAARLELATSIDKNGDGPVVCGAELGRESQSKLALGSDLGRHVRSAGHRGVVPQRQSRRHVEQGLKANQLATPTLHGRSGRCQLDSLGHAGRESRRAFPGRCSRGSRQPWQGITRRVAGETEIVLHTVRRRLRHVAGGPTAHAWQVATPDVSECPRSG